MNLKPIKPGDIVQCDIRGQTFYAQVTEQGVTGDGNLFVTTLRNSAYRQVTARQVTGHWRKMGRPRKGASE